MKLLKKLMAGAMAIAMLSVYMVAFATGTGSGLTATTSGASATASGVGTYAGAAKGVFQMVLPTAAANSALAFTVDPKQVIQSSPPSDALSPDSTYGTVVFSTASGANSIYKNTSEPLRVLSMSSMDVTVNMFASLSDTKMTLSTTSGFTGANDAQSHLYLGVQVATVSGGTATASGGAIAISALGAKNAAVLKAASQNFKASTTSGGTVFTMSGGIGADDTSWNGVEYTVVGASNSAADWKIPGIDAPILTIKWMVNTEDEITYPITAPTGSAFTAMLDKDAYKAGETVNLYIKPNSATAKPSAVKLKYIALKATDGTMDQEKTGTFTVNTTNKANGVYSATFTVPTDMALSNSPKGNVSTYKAPSWEISVS